MNDVCRHEPNVLRAAADDRWSESLRAHVLECADCAAAASIASFMSRLARVDERPHPLPDPAVVWLKAQLLGSIAEAERLTRPLNIFQMIAYVAVAGGWAGLLMWRWPDLQAWMVSFTSGNATMSVSAALSVAILASMTLMLALHTIVED